MRLQGLKESDRIQLDADPEWSEQFLGPEPVLSPVDGRVWDLYWTTRRSQPADSMAGPLPLDLVRALDLNRELFGLAEPRRLAAKLQAMDGAYLADVSERAKRRADEKKKQGSR